MLKIPDLTGLVINYLVAGFDCFLILGEGIFFEDEECVIWGPFSSDIFGENNFYPVLKS